MERAVEPEEAKDVAAKAARHRQHRAEAPARDPVKAGAAAKDRVKVPARAAERTGNKKTVPGQLWTGT